MKKLFFRFLSLFLLLVVFTASSSVVSAHQSTPAKSAIAAKAQSCGWVNQETYQLYGAHIILWEYTCDGGYHCQIVNDSWNGSAGVILYSGSDFGPQEWLDSNGGPFTYPGESYNTRTFHGASAYSCGGSTNS